VKYVSTDETEYSDEFLTAENMSLISIRQKMKVVSEEWCHKGSQALKKFQPAASAGKVMFTVFWDVKGTVHSKFIPIGTRVHC